MLKRNEVKATCDICGEDICKGDGMMVEWPVDDPSAEECGQRFICGDCLDDDPGAAEAWQEGLLEEHPEAEVIEL